MSTHPDFEVRKKIAASQERVRQALAGKGLKEMTFSFDFQGAHVLVNDPFIDNDSRTASRWTFVPTSAD